MTRVVAPSRLHFGLLHVPVEGLTHWPDGTPVRHFGGLGLMIDRPGLEVGVEPADGWTTTGPLAERALGIARRFSESACGLAKRCYRIKVHHSPPEHVGLGVGTQLGMAVCKAMAVESSFGPLTTTHLAALSGRGERSGIGVHGFDRGGFLLDGGKIPGQTLSPLAARFEFPEEWSVIVAYPAESHGIHGEAERTAFARRRSPEAALRTTERLARLALTAVLPALAERNYPLFAEALHEFNRTAGEPFAHDQGGAYSTPEIAQLIRVIRQDMKVPGVGQSSWGPAVFAITPDIEVGSRLAEWLRNKLPSHYRLVACRANNTGAVVS
jgi:beta-ribofuranosylaminobenzene 5'-phosphate synthase